MGQKTESDLATLSLARWWVRSVGSGGSAEVRLPEVVHGRDSETSNLVLVTATGRPDSSTLLKTDPKIFDPLRMRIEMGQ